MANHNLSPVILLGGLSVNLNHLKSSIHTNDTKDTSFASDTGAVGTKDTSFTSVDSGTKSTSSSRGTKGSGHGCRHKQRSSSTGPIPKKRHALR